MNSSPTRLSFIAIALTVLTSAVLLHSLYSELSIIETIYRREIPQVMTIGAALRYEEKVHSLRTLELACANGTLISDSEIEELQLDMDRLAETVNEIKRIDQASVARLVDEYEKVSVLDRELIARLKARDLAGTKRVLDAKKSESQLAFREALQKYAEDLSMKRDFALEQQNRQFRVTITGVSVAILVVSAFWGIVVLAFRRARSSREAVERQLEEERAIRVHAVKLGALGEMAGGIAHEINNPLAIIGGSVQQLLDTLANKSTLTETEMRDRIEKNGLRIQKTVERISKIVNSLRTFARDAEKDEHQYTPISQLVEDIMALSSERARHFGVQMNIVDFEDVELHCNYVQIEQVLINLLNNAIDAICELKDKVIELRFFSTGDHFLITVKDSGSGIPDSVAEKIMEPFFTTKEVGKGTGLGLSVSMGIAKAHGGRLYYDRHSANTTFVLELPKTLIRPLQPKVEHLNAS